MTASILLFPAQVIQTQSWSVFKTPNFKTRKQRATSGRTLYTQDYQFPIWNWTLTYELLKDNQDIRASNGFPVSPGDFLGLRTLMGFFNQTQGGFLPFLFFDPTDCYVEKEGFFDGPDGVRTQFPFSRQLDGSSGLSEPIHAVIFSNDVALKAAAGLTGSTDILVYIDDVLQDPTSYTGVQHPDWGDASFAIKFNSPPADGTAITATFYYFFAVRFAMDSLEFENFFANYWGLKQLKLESYLIPQT